MDIRAFLLLYTGCLKTSSFWQHPATCRAALPPSIHKSLQSVWPFAAARCWQNDLVFQPPGKQGGLKIICEVSTMDFQPSQSQFLINFPHYSVCFLQIRMDLRWWFSALEFAFLIDFYQKSEDFILFIFYIYWKTIKNGLWEPNQHYQRIFESLSPFTAYPTENKGGDKLSDMTGCRQKVDFQRNKLSHTLRTKPSLFCWVCEIGIWLPSIIWGHAA